MRIGLSGIALLVAMSASGCSLFDTPCGKVANSICTIPGEDRSCRFLRDVARDNKVAQDACTELEPVAVEYAKNPDSVLQKGKWLAASVALRAFGLVGDATRKSTREKVAKSAEEAGEELGEAAEEAGEAIGEAAEKAGAAIGEALEKATK